MNAAVLTAAQIQVGSVTALPRSTLVNCAMIAATLKTTHTR